VYLQDGVPVYCYNFLGSATTYVRGKPLAAGRHKPLLKFRPNGNGPAAITMQVDSTDRTRGTVPKLTPMPYEASGGLSVGLDQGRQVPPETAGAAPVAIESLRFEFAQHAPLSK
jgi:arylsulfatase